MNGSLECRGADNRDAAYRGAATPGESMWKTRARSASLHFDHTVLAELIARRWNQDRGYFALKMTGWRRVAEEPRGGGNRIAMARSCRELSLARVRIVSEGPI
jgi:hypothetical protein